MIDTTEIRTRLDRAGIQRADMLALCDEIDQLREERYNTLMGKELCKTPPQGRMVEFATTIYVDSYGNIARDRDEVRMNLGRSFRSYTITAMLPVPAEVEVVARVEGE